MHRYTVTLIEDDEGNLVLPLPRGLFEGDRPWLIDDKLDWSIQDDKVTITNISWKNRNKS